MAFIAAAESSISTLLAGQSAEGMIGMDLLQDFQLQQVQSRFRKIRNLMGPAAFQNLHLAVVKLDWVGAPGTGYLKVTLAQRQNHIVVVVGVKLSGLTGRNLYAEYTDTIIGQNLMEVAVKFQVNRTAGNGARGRAMYIEIVSRNLSV